VKIDLLWKNKSSIFHLDLGIQNLLNVAKVANNAEVHQEKYQGWEEVQNYRD